MVQGRGRRAVRARGSRHADGALQLRDATTTASADADGGLRGRAATRTEEDGTIDRRHGDCEESEGTHTATLTSGQ